MFSNMVVTSRNHLDRLDPALIRPGRADVLRFIGDASPEQVIVIVMVMVAVAVFFLVVVVFVETHKIKCRSGFLSFSFCL